MKPANCHICGKSAVDEVIGSNGEWVEFNNYKPETSGDLSHPEGFEYFCSEHFPFAHKLAHKKSDDALAELKIMFSGENSSAFKAKGKPAWWRRLIGW